jgi:vanillate O-demethylase ferredoxin subunit
MLEAPVLEVRVARKQREAEGIASFELVRVDGGELPPFTAGAHVDVHVNDSLVRQYSLCNAPGERHRYVIAVQREPQSRGGSAAMHEQLNEGSVLRIGQPRNLFALSEGAPHSLLIAGGIGVTPLMAMAETLSSQGASYELHLCARTSSRLAFTQRLAEARFAGRVQRHCDDGPPEQRFDAEAALSACPAGTHVYVCGPGGFMDHVLGTARGLGWADERLHREDFSAPPVDHSHDGSFELLLQRSSRVIRVAADQTALQALWAAGVDVPSSCEQGICGTCMTPVLDGIPDHRDQYLTEEEQARNDCFTPCCSRAKSARLVVDL